MKRSRFNDDIHEPSIWYKVFLVAIVVVALIIACYFADVPDR